MASAAPTGAPGLGGTREEWEAFDEEHYDGCFLRHPNGDPMDDPILTDAGRQYLKLKMGFGMSATHAAHHWDLGSLRLALTAGASPEDITSEYINHGPLHAACDTIRFHYDQLDGKETFRVGKTEDDGVACVQLLLHAGASLDVLSFHGFTPLHLVARLRILDGRPRSDWLGTGQRYANPCHAPRASTSSGFARPAASAGTSRPTSPSSSTCSPRSSGSPPTSCPSSSSTGRT